MKNSDSQSRLLALKADFEVFRTHRVGNPPIPGELRQAVLGAIASGIPQGQVCKATLLSANQIKIWKTRSQVSGKSILTKAQPRILDIISSSPVSGRAAAGLRISFEAGRLMLDLSL